MAQKNLKIDNNIIKTVFDALTFICSKKLFERNSLRLAAQRKK